MISLRRALVVVALAASAPAAAEQGTDYALLRVGTYLPQATPSLSSGTYNAGLDVELGVGRAFYPWLAGEIAVGYVGAGSDAHTGFYFTPPTQIQVEMRESFTLVPITASLRFILPAGSIEPYAAGGAGAYLARFEKEPTGSLPSVVGSSTVLGFHAGAGAAWRASDRVQVGLDGRYLFLRVKFQNETHNLEGLGITVAVAYRF